ncbi:ATP-binding protein [Streptomyces sp. SGAir0957]
MDYTMVHKSVPLVRLHVHRRLVVWGWAGDQGEAALVASELTTNAINHARIVGHTMLVRLAVLSNGGLVVDVSDPVPAFPDFGVHAAVDRLDECGRGLRLVRAVGGEVSWFLREHVGKTVRVEMPGEASCG